MRSSFVFRLPAIASAKVGRSYFVNVSRFAFRVVCHPEGVKRPKDPVGAVCKRDSSSAAGGLRMTRFLSCTSCLMLLVSCLMMSCGGEKGSDDDLAALQDPATNLSETQKDLAPKSADEFWKSIIYSKHYGGELLVTFQRDSDIRLRFSKFVSMKGTNLDQINHYIQQMGAKASRSLAQLSESQIESAVKSSMARGENFTDWNLIYRIKIKDPDHAYELMNILKDSPLVKDIQPLPIPSVSDAGITPNISGDQNYLKSNAQSGGLNVEAAWSKASGEGVIIADSEGNWNFDHEDLPIDQDDVVYVPMGGIPDNYYEYGIVQHGTAVVGVLNGLDNNSGIKGVAYGSQVKLAHTDNVTSGPIGTINTYLENYNNGNYSEAILYEGDILLIEMHLPGPTTGDKSCGDEFNGCVPIEAYPYSFGAISEATDLGIVVITVAANGSVDLDTPAGHIQVGPDLSNFVPGSENDSGSIMVGASTGGSHEKALWSNCGSRVNVYAWGYDVTTTGYGDHTASDPANQNKWYTANFSGTSSAAAIVAGAAAVIQSYAREFYGHNPPYKNVYLDSHQMRDLLIASGQSTPFLPGTDPQDPHPNCNIGVQPDVNYALQLLDEGYVVPNVKYKPQTKSSTKLDIDDDGRGDLIIYAGDKWYIDLSSEGQGGDNFGAWDLEIEMTDGNDYYEPHLDPPNIPYSQVQPVVADYNSDGLADLALYGLTNGVWYISYTDVGTYTDSEWHGWDRIVNYHGDPNWRWYSRPVHGDYDGDGWIDLALQTPDGYWLIDYGDNEGTFPLKGINDDHETLIINYQAEPYLKDNWGEFVDYEDDPATPDVDETRKGIVKYLTDEQLEAAPGWAYLPFIKWSNNKLQTALKIPDGVSINGELNFQEGNFFEAVAPKFNNIEIEEYYVNLGGNDWIPVPAAFFFLGDISVKVNGSGNWFIADMLESYEVWLNTEPNGIFGGVNCKPIPADYDGDKKDDRTVFCADTNEWIIAYSSNVFSDQMQNGYRTVITPDVISETIEPANIYPGGTKYADIKDTFEDLGADIQNLVPPILPKFNICFQEYLENPTADLASCFE